jgi:arylformamidase
MPTRTNITAPIHRRKFVTASAATVFAPSLARAQGQVGNNNGGWGMLTRADRDAAYNNAAAVSDSTQIMARMSEASEKLRGQRSKHLDLPYGAGERAQWDLFPSDNPKAPILVHIHGGYWQTRKREDFSCLAEGVLARGWSAALPGYTLAPAANLAQIAQEMRNALDWLTGHGSAHGMTGPIIISGWSAGGHLTSLVLDHPGVKAGLAISGIYELGPIRDTYLNAALKLSEEEIKSLSPLRLPGVNKPLAIAYGTAELPALVRNSREYHAHRAQSHLPGPLIPVPNANHFTILEELRSPNGILTRSVMRLMEDTA